MEAGLRVGHFARLSALAGDRALLSAWDIYSWRWFEPHPSHQKGAPHGGAPFVIPADAGIQNDEWITLLSCLFDNTNFFVCQAIEFVDQLVDLLIGGVDLAFQSCLLSL